MTFCKHPCGCTGLAPLGNPEAQRPSRLSHVALRLAFGGGPMHGIGAPESSTRRLHSWESSTNAAHATPTVNYRGFGEFSCRLENASRTSQPKPHLCSACLVPSGSWSSALGRLRRCLRASGPGQRAWLMECNSAAPQKKHDFKVCF